MNCRAEPVPPPGAGLLTTMLSVVPCARSLAVRPTCNSVELTSVADRATLLIVTREDELKLDPFIARVIAALPAGTLAGDRMLSCGAGLFTVKLTTVVGFPPGFPTLTRKLPAVAIALAGMFACNCAGLINA